MLVTVIPDEWLSTTEPGLQAGSHFFNLHIAPVSRRWLVQICLDLSFLHPIAMAIGFSPARRPAKSGLRQPRETGTIYKLDLLIVLQ